jgi:hypothetical protein
MAALIAAGREVGNKDIKISLCDLSRALRPRRQGRERTRHGSTTEKRPTQSLRDAITSANLGISEGDGIGTRMRERPNITRR